MTRGGVEHLDRRDAGCRASPAWRPTEAGALAGTEQAEEAPAVVAEPTGDTALAAARVREELLPGDGIPEVDDAIGLRGRQKLAGQIVAICVLCWSGMTIQNLRLFDWEIDLGLLAVPFTVCWLLGAINAMNLLDGADGVAATVSLVISMAVAILALTFGRPVEAAIAAAMAGALMGMKAVVHYTVDPLGLVQDVWILTDAERAKQPWPTKAADAKAWSFDPIAQVWTKP